MPHHPLLEVEEGGNMGVLFMFGRVLLGNVLIKYILSRMIIGFGKVPIVECLLSHCLLCNFMLIPAGYNSTISHYILV